jgi:dipeptidyl aminopeptidase/acylaminoacyl peptidase
LFTIDLETRKITDLMPGSERLLSFWSMSGSWDISPAGDEIALSANSTEPPYRELNFDVFVLPASGGELVNLTEDNPAWDGSPRYSPDGKHLLYGRKNRAEIAPDFTRFALMDRESRQVTDLASGWDGQPADWTFSPDGRMVFFHAQDHGRRHLYSIPVDGTLPRLVVRGGTARGAAVGPGGVVVLSLESATQPAELIAVKADGSKRRPLTAYNVERLAELDLGTVQDVTFEGADGDPVQMWVVLPPGFDAERKWPLLQLVHGGPHGAWLDAFHYRWNMALFASKGRVVAAVNFHGSTGAGQAFAESILGAHAGRPFTDIMAATDNLIAREYVDESRMAAAGGSYGGYMASWILGHTDRFAAIINHAGVYDLMGQFASDYTWGRANNYGATPWDDPDRIDLWSPSRYAAGFETPTLILHGEQDYRVPYTQGLNLYGVLTAKGVPARLVIFPGENHWIMKPQGAAVWWDEVFDWLERWAPAGASN